MNWKKRNDSGRIFRLTLSWKAPSIQIRIFLKAHLDIFFTWIGLPSGIPSTHETSESSHRNIRLIRATERGHQLTTGKRAERTERDFRWSICCSAIVQASCLICVRRRQLRLPFYSVISFWNRSPEWFKSSSTRIRVKSYAVSKISLDSCARGPKTVQGSFCWIQSRMSL